METREKVIEIISKINNSKRNHELKKYNSELVDMLRELPNLKSDSYKPISLAIQLINQKQNRISQSRQFVINILLTILGIGIAALVGFGV